MIYDCIIVGAGAAGLFCGAAFPAHTNGLILEKNKKDWDKAPHERQWTVQYHP